MLTLRQTWRRVRGKRGGGSLMYGMACQGVGNMLSAQTPYVNAHQQLILATKWHPTYLSWVWKKRQKALLIGHDILILVSSTPSRVFASSENQLKYRQLWFEVTACNATKSVIVKATCIIQCLL